MDEVFSRASAMSESHPPGMGYRPVSGTYLGRNGLNHLELRVDLDENAQRHYQPLDIVSGDFFRDAGCGERDHLYSFIVEHAYIRWEAEQVVVIGEMTYCRNTEPPYTLYDAHARHILKVTISLSTIRQSPSPATVHVIRWGRHKTTYLCEKKSAFLRTIDLEIDRISGTELPRTFRTHSVTECPPDLPFLEMGIAASPYARTVS